MLFYLAVALFIAAFFYLVFVGNGIADTFLNENQGRDVFE